MVIKIFIAWLLTLFLLVFIPVYGLSESSRQEKALARITNESAERGAEIYITTCVSCHGQKGEGVVGPPLRNTKLERESLFKAISFGRLTQAVPMPAFGVEMGGPLKKHQIDDVVNFVKNWNHSFIINAQAKHAAPVKPTEVRAAKEAVPVKAAPGSPDARKILSTPPTAGKAPEESPGQSIPGEGTSTVVATSVRAPPAQQVLSEGKELYTNFGCAACHGPEGKGAAGPSLLGKNKEEFMRLVRSPRSPAMPSFSPERLSDANLNKIIDFLNSVVIK